MYEITAQLSWLCADIEDITGGWSGRRTSDVCLNSQPVVSSRISDDTHFFGSRPSRLTMAKHKKQNARFIDRYTNALQEFTSSETVRRK